MCTLGDWVAMLSQLSMDTLSFNENENINFDKTDIFDTEENSINIKFNINYGYDFSIRYNKNEFNEAYSINLNKYF